MSTNHVSECGLPILENERSKLNYLVWDDVFHQEKPYEVLSASPDGLKRKNFSMGPGMEETVYDARKDVSKYHLEDHGFELRTHELTLSTFDKASIEKQYFPIVESILRSAIPEAEVFLFDWRVSTIQLADLLNLGPVQ
jgi:hypothetical protein